MVKVYANLVYLGLKTLQEVPAALRQKVALAVAEMRKRDLSDQ